MNKEEFINEVKKLNINITDKELNLLDKYFHLLISWNEKINLTTITKEKDVYLKHFYDSLTLTKQIDFSKDIYLCDVGSGAGLPGIVIKIFFPNVKIKLIDSLQKRVNYLNEIIRELGLTNIDAEHFRMEDYSKIHTEEFDCITARAVAHLGILAEISVNALKINGQMIFMKGNCDDEVNAFLANTKKLGLVLDSVTNFMLPFEYSNRTLIKLTKVTKTNSIYPRRIDIIKKEYIK